MITVTPIRYSRANKVGTYPLAVRITKDGTSSYVFIGKYIHKDQWDKSSHKVKSSHPSATYFNALLSKKVAEANKIHISDEVQDKDTSAQAIHEAMHGRKMKQLFFDIAHKHLRNLELEGKYNQCSSDKARLGRFRSFLKGKDISFEKITVSLLKDYKAYCKGSHGNSERTVMNNLIAIRTIFNRAIADGIVDYQYYPFGKHRVVIRFAESLKIGLSEDEILRIIKLNLADHPKIDNARNIWLVSFLFAGMRVSDVLRLRWSDIVDGRLHYKMGKNQKAVSLVVVELAQALIERYRKYQIDPDSLIFQELTKVTDWTDTYDVGRKIKNADKLVNRYLDKLATKAKIDKKLRCHISRHSFGGIAGDHIPSRLLQKLYLHSHLSTTENYQGSFRVKNADDALRAVVHFTKKSEFASPQESKS